MQGTLSQQRCALLKRNVLSQRLEYHLTRERLTYFLSLDERTEASYCECLYNHRTVIIAPVNEHASRHHGEVERRQYGTHPAPRTQRGS